MNNTVHWLILLCVVMLGMALGKHALAANKEEPYKPLSHLHEFTPPENPEYKCYYDDELGKVVLCHLKGLPLKVIVRK